MPLGIPGMGREGDQANKSQAGKKKLIHKIMITHAYWPVIFTMVIPQIRAIQPKINARMIRLVFSFFL